MTYTDDESSIEDSRPREGFEIRHGVELYRLASGTRNLLIDGNLYTAFPINRGEYGVSFVGGQQQELEIKLPLTHPFTKRYFQGAVPPKTIMVTARRKQLRSGQSRQFWFGQISSCNIEGEVASFRAPPLSADALDRPIPNFTVGRNCPYILYEAGCEVSRASFQITTTVTVVDGQTVTLASDGGNPNQWLRDGELVHVASGERMTISNHVGNVVTMQLPIFELKTGDQVIVFAGCDHLLSTCRDKFNNLVNFGGAPQLPRGNIFLPNGYGVWQSS